MTTIAVIDNRLHIAGGCSGSTSEHIAHVRERVMKHPPRKVPRIEPRMRLSGLEPFVAGCVR